MVLLFIEVVKMKTRNSTKRIYRRKARLRDYLLLLFFSPLNSFCYFCGKKLSEEDVPNKQDDLLTIHHVDENRKNENLSNLRIAHEICHKRYHFNKDKVWEFRNTNGKE